MSAASHAKCSRRAKARKLVDELRALDNACGLDTQSQLSCCVKVKEQALVIELPRYAKNLAREK